MKKTIIIIMSAALMLASAQVCAYAAEDGVSAKVTVNIANAGELVVTAQTVDVTDADGDGKLTVSDALYAAHEKYYDGGASAGYATEQGQWGLSITRLWGVENGGSYGYYVNDAMAMGLADEIAAGDLVYAYTFADTATFADTYSFFDLTTVDSNVGGKVDLTLSKLGFDNSFNTVKLPVAGAKVTVDGKPTELKTDASGRVTLELGAGRHIVSAVSDTDTLVPPVCAVNVANSNSPTAPKTGAVDAALVLAATAVIVTLALTLGKRKYED